MAETGWIVGHCMRDLTHPEPLDRATAERLLASAAPDVVAEALVSIAFHENDWRWVTVRCAEAASHPSLHVRAVISTCFGHLARIHRVIDWEIVESVPARLSAGHRLAGRIEDARDHFEVFLGQRYPWLARPADS